MTSKKIITVLLLLLVAASVFVLVGRQAGWISASSGSGLFGSSTKDHRIIAYYFHGTVRCETCLHIEQYTNETLKTYFADNLADGTLEWRVINREEPANEHFVQDYSLYSQALILVDSLTGRPSESKNLEAIWDHAGDKTAFIEYVRGEVNQYLGRL